MSGSSRGNLSKIGLIGGVILAVALSASTIGWGLFQSADYQRQADYQASQNANHTDQKIGQTCRRLAPVEKQQCLTQARDEQRAYQRNEQDLVAQRQSALWAYIMAAAAVVGVCLSVFGVILIWTTFNETREANRITLAEQRPWINFETIEVTMTHEAEITSDSHGGTIRTIKPGKVPCFVLEYRIVNQGRSPAYDIDWRSNHLKGEWQIVGEPDIYSPNDAAFYKKVIGDRRGTFIKCLLPGESVPMTAVLGVTDDTMSERVEGKGPRLFPRYAALATYRGVGIAGRGETGKVFTFHTKDPIDFDPTDGIDRDGLSVVVSVAERATHVI